MIVARVLQVAQLIRAGHKFTASQIAARLMVSDKTIYRDIETLKDLGAPLVFRSTPTRWVTQPGVSGGYWEWRWNTPNLPWYFGGPNNKPKTIMFPRQQ